MKLTVNVPATTANLGPGFDCLGLALQWWNTLVVEDARALDVRVRGLSEGLPADVTNVAVQAMTELFGRVGREFPPLRITMTNRIPIGRGLGSSAAAIVGGLVAANAWAGDPLSAEEVLEMATASIVLGMIGFHFLAMEGWVDAFLNASMLLGGMGPVGEIRSTPGKIFAGIFALYAGLVFIAAFLLLTAPALHRLLHKHNAEKR